MATPLRWRSNNYWEVAHARRRTISSRRRDAGNIFLSDRPLRTRALDEPVDFTRIEKRRTTDDGAARQRFSPVYRAAQAQPIHQASTSEHRYDRCNLASTISGLQHERSGGSPAAGGRDGRRGAHSAAHAVRHGWLCLACRLRQRCEVAFGALAFAPERN